MAMSLEDLLAEEGFKGSSSKRMTRASSGPSTRRIPSYPARDEHKSGAATRLRKTDRAYSDARRYDLRVESPITDRVKNRRSLDILKMEKLDRGARNEPKERHIRRGSQDTRDVTGYSVDSSQQISIDEIVEVKEGIRRVKDGTLDKGGYKDIYLNGVFSPPISKNKQKYSRTGEEERYENISGKDVQIDDGYANDYDKHLPELAGSSDNYQKGGKQPGSSSSRSNKSTHNKENVRDSRVRKPVEIESVAEVALDDVAIKAMISILSGYIKCFLKDQDFRTSLYHNCFAALNSSKLEEDIVAESKIISNLDQAIETVEKAAEKRANAKELKKASLQLSVITGLNANDLKDGFTSGIPNSILSACGHLYLSVIYQLQKKERIAAKHILQTFCDSPSAARTTLVPELWETVFHPHLSHLEVWYNQEVHSLADDPHNTRKLKQLKKVYYEILNSGTYQFALYYKDWLTDGVEAPSVPSIHVPSVSVQGNQHEGVSGRSSDFGSPSFSSQPMVSKKLYDSVFGGMHKQTTAEAEDYHYSQRSDDDKYSFDGSVVEDKRTLTHSLEEDEYEDLGVKRDKEPYQASQEELLGGFGNFTLKLEELGSTSMLQSLPVSEVNELTLKRLAKFVFGLHQTERSVDVIETNRLSHSDDAIYPDFSPIVTKPLGEGGKLRLVLPGNYADGGGHFFLHIPQDYVCPLTKLIFEDPVTLETGQTYERAAIVEWLNKGNTTCPVTGKTLECQIMPFTNSVLKRVIDGWKSKHSREILASASQPAGSPGEQKYKAEAAVFILEQLLTVFGTEENTANAKHLLALGGLQFLIRRFAYGNLDERSRVAALLSHCIKADSGCRNHVARHIEKQGLLELLHCKGIKSRANAVFLLFDLICLNSELNAHFATLSSELFTRAKALGCRAPVAPGSYDVDQQKYSIYREEAVDTISSALDTSLSNEKVRETCCSALLILGGHISYSGKVVTEDWILKNAGFFDRPESDALDDKISIKDNILLDNDEEEAVEDWLMKLSASLLGDGKKSFLDSLSQCLSSGHQDMTMAGLTTVAWFSSSLVSLPGSESQLSSFSVLIPKLKEHLKNSEWLEHKILAAMSLLNFSKIPDCMNLLMRMADEIASPLRNLSEASWMAKELHAFISQEDL
ncbi:Armadillo-like helical [Cynara cardunculus var. scolymus]|uniref:RING-type E3 ubiquitin transferase n=1 Tax=Cynara cardunculus var. scolymus TaxID=59895 RepID=A0A118K5P6_CYNCS|nr:Armadillo-like helical [Cynara cardunculus var. scolymus]